MRFDLTSAFNGSLLLLTLLAAPLSAAKELGPCEDAALGPDAKCGFIEVFEDREAGSGRTLNLNVMVLPATGTEVREPLFFLAGGPGQGATDLAGLALQPFAAVREVRDVVLVDQRGTGASAKIDCPIDAAEAPQDVFGQLFDIEATRRCLERVKEDANPKLYTTDLVVDDLDQIRRQLGYEKVLLAGGSGGTRTALVWMRRHPERVVGAMLDSVAPTDFRAPSSMARGCQDSLDKVFEECRQQEACHAAFPDLQGDFARLLALFDKGPVETYILDQNQAQVPIEMHRGDFTYGVRSALYQSRSLVDLPGMIHEAAASGDPHLFAQAYWRRQVGVRPFVAMGVHFGVYCSEDLPFIAADEVAGFTEGTFVGRYLYEQYKGACDAWEADPVDRSFLEPVISDVPVLILSGYYDPSTPPRLGDQVASHLPNSRHVVVRNESHGAEFGCARPAVIEFLRSGSLEGLGEICAEVGAIQYEVRK